MLMNLALPTSNILYVYKRVYTLSFVMHVLGWEYWFLVCVWGKTGRRRRFGYFGGGGLETTDLGSGIGVHSSVYPNFDGFRSLGVGVLLALGGYELVPV
jgi:hypothetical protein